MAEITLKVEDFAYVAEGSAHIILSYVGKDQAALKNKVLRVALESSAESGEKEKIFVSSVMIPLMGSAYADAGVPVPCTTEFLAALEDAVASERHYGKLGKHAIDKGRDHVLLMRNTTAGLGPDSWCVEIKPKYCLLSRSKLLPQNLGIKYQYPFFKMMFSEGKIGEYDPSDMLSGDEIRMRKAIDALWSKRHKWLRIFRHGKVVKDTQETLEPSIVESLFHETVQALSANRACLEKISAVQALEYADSYGAKLIKDELLSREPNMVLSDEIWESYMQMHNAEPAAQDFIAFPTAAEARSNSNSETFEEARASLKEVPSKDLIRYLADFLIAAVGKDLGVMVCLRTGEDGSWEHEVNLVDLGMKGDEKLEGWYTRDIEIVQSFKDKEADRTDV